MLCRLLWKSAQETGCIPRGWQSLLGSVQAVQASPPPPMCTAAPSRSPVGCLRLSRPACLCSMSLAPSHARQHRLQQRQSGASRRRPGWREAGLGQREGSHLGGWGWALPGQHTVQEKEGPSRPSCKQWCYEVVPSPREESNRHHGVGTWQWAGGLSVAPSWRERAHQSA